MPNTDKQPDPLGYDVYAETLWARIQLALNKDSGNATLGDDPLVVGLFGEWGAGKSHLLGLIQELAEKTAQKRIKDRNGEAGGLGDAGFGLTIPVFFQPWKYEHEPHLLVPLLLHILTALEESAKLAQTPIEKGTAIVGKAGDVLVSALPSVVTGFKALATSVVATLATANPMTGVGLGVASGLASHAATAQKKRLFAAKPKANEFVHTEDGRAFYKMHEILKHITRPNKHPSVIPGINISQDIRINFVVFIDDLDRCLPEKAVQSLELIKTIFNVESFAFVLALDDEVIERGIGHRYKEYKLHDKKPEMPITGFEYLEKIVHLPFRLPALTYTQAARFIQIKEQAIQPAPADNLNLEEKATNDKRLFFHYDHARVGMRVGGRLGIDERASEFTNILLASFDQYVPRKLIRAIELLYQVRDIAAARGKELVRSTTIDSRILFGLLLLQLFQPEIFRVLRRRKAALPSILAAFLSDPFGLDTDAGLGEGSNISESRLWQWACLYTDTALINDEAKDAHKNTEAPTDYKSALAYIATKIKGNAGNVYTAQQIRLPLADRLVAHLQIERHAFNPFKLLKKLSSYTHADKVGQIDINLYLEFLSENAPLAPPAATNEKIESRYEVSADRVSSLPTGVIKTLFERMTSRDLGVQGELIDLLQAEPIDGKKLASESADALHKMLEQWLNEKTTPDEKTEAKTTALRGLQYLAPHLAALSSTKFWSFVKDAVTLPYEPNTLTEDPPLASLYCDVRSMLGQDDRFDANHFYLLKDRYEGHTKKEEPIIGFVRMEGGKFKSADMAHQTVTYDAGSRFYMSRSHVTVDQYAAFLASKPHENKDLWDTQGWAWVMGELDKTIINQDAKDLQSLLEFRTGTARHEPYGWVEQQRIGGRAVHGTTWFEARAYARWLDLQLKTSGKLGDLTLPTNAPSNLRYQVRLPTELQWEYVASSAGTLGRWPWGNEENTAHQRCNISNSNIRHANVAGCFAPSAQGLWDITGNLRQWQDGLFMRVNLDLMPKISSTSLIPINSTFQRLPKGYRHTLGNRWSNSDLVALRGGTWIGVTNLAANSERYGYRIGSCNDYTGFRVVLSLAENES